MPIPSEGRFQAFSGANFTQPQVEEKDCEARPPHPPLLRRKGSAIFSIASALDALGPKMHLDVSSWLAVVVVVVVVVIVVVVLDTS